ncbi:MAG TPA: ArsA family ATPase, partial [Vicinamibacterales bacterium]
MPTWHFVGGKGGVGKTTCAAAFAIRSATRHRTLLVSTDPASSLSDALGLRVGSAPRPVPGSGQLWAANLDAAKVFASWLAPRRDLIASMALRGTYLDEEDVGRLLRLSLPGLDEIVGLLGLVRLASKGRYDEVIVDTAPTGHTLRLLSAPSLFGVAARLLDGFQAHHREVVSALRGRYTADAADRLIVELEADGATLAGMLRDREVTRLSWVCHAEPMALEETADAIATLTASGLRPRTIVANRLGAGSEPSCDWCEARRRFESRALFPLARRLPDLALIGVPDLVAEPRGVRGLARVAAGMRTLRLSKPLPPIARRITVERSTRDAVQASGVLPRVRWLLFGGKGGVGKTTCAAAYALSLAKAAPTGRVLLISTDPAHSLGDVLSRRRDRLRHTVDAAPANLQVREIDAAANLDRFRDRYVEYVDAAFERFGGAAAARQAVRQLMDLAPPGIDEVMAIADVADLLADSASRFDTVVSDTAPTGHVLRLLQTPAILREWTQALMAILLKYREVVSAGPLAPQLVRLSKQLRALETLLHDPGHTQFVLVTRA